MWENQRDVASAVTGNHYPRIKTDREGNPLIIWENAKDVIFTRWNGTDFDTPKIINPNNIDVAGASWMGPDLAAHGDTIYIVYKQSPEHEGKAWITHSYDRGETFSTPLRLDFIGDSLARFPAVTTDDEGHPVVAYMKFNSSFGAAQWVAMRSYDFGNSFTKEVLASRWSSDEAFACDCCPGTIVSNDETVAMLYRDNNLNIRDSWAGISTDGGETFNQGLNIDEQNWMQMSCPASGPDGVIIGDTLYSTFMNGATGKNLVYFSKTSLSTLETTGGELLTGNFAGLSQQNFPRVASYGDALGVVWKQVVSGQEQLVFKFTSDIKEGLPVAYDTLDLDKQMNVDIAMSDGKVFTVWEDYSTGTVKFRAGTFEVRTGINNNLKYEILDVFPNPSSDVWVLKGEVLKSGSKIEIYDAKGQLIDVVVNRGTGGVIEISNLKYNSGSYVVRVVDGDRVGVKMVVKH